MSAPLSRPSPNMLKTEFISANPELLMIGGTVKSRTKNVSVSFALCLSRLNEAYLVRWLWRERFKTASLSLTEKWNVGQADTTAQVSEWKRPIGASVSCTESHFITFCTHRYCRCVKCVSVIPVLCCYTFCSVYSCCNCCSLVWLVSSGTWSGCQTPLGVCGGVFNVCYVMSCYSSGKLGP